MSLSRYKQFDLSGGLQNATSFLMKKGNELADLRNGRFGVELGSIVRRLGHDRVGSTFGAGGQNTPTGGFVAKYATGNVRFVAVNNSGNTATIVRTQPTSGGSWTTLSSIPTIPVNAKVNFFLFLDEVYVSGWDPATGDPITPFNVNSALSVSLTRNILDMPACRYIAEFGGALYAANVKIGSTRFRDRAYKSSGPLGFITTVNSAQAGALTQITVDSARYLKVGMAIDLYRAGTSTKAYDFDITAVDKSLNKITMSPSTQAFTISNVNAATDVITVPSTTYLPTATPVQISSTSGVPGGLTAGVTYYVINVSSTTIKLATTSGNATNSVAIDITSAGATQTFATGAVNTGTDIITLGNTTALSTGMPIVFTSTTTVPAGLTSGTIYYCIVLSSTTIAAATTVANAEAGTKIDITSVGAGTHTITSGAHTIGQYYTLADNDELWLDGRKDTLNIMWNKDYPTPETADWTATLPGIDSSNEITGVGKSSNRLFLFTKNSGQKFDGANTVTYNNSVGCIAPGSVKNIDDDWIVWLDAKGRVWARNESNGQQEYISRGIYKKIMKYITATNLTNATAVVNNNLYYLYLGQNDVGNGNEYIRVVYSFDDNVWAVDRLARPALYADNDDYSGEMKPYFWCNDGYLYIDDTGNLDYDVEIPLEVELGRDNFGGVQLKKFDGCFVYSEDAAGMTVKVSVGGKQAKTVGQITEDECYMKFPERGEDQLPRGSSINAFITGSSTGDPQKIQGIEWYFTSEEEVPSDRRPT